MSRPWILVVSITLLLAAAVAWWLLRAGPALPPGTDAPFTRVDCWFAGRPRAECAWFRPSVQDSTAATALPVVVLRRAVHRHSRIASIYLMGGPGGGSYLDGDGMEGWVEWRRELGLDHDFVLYDQRGTGLARPALECPRYFDVQRAQLTSAASEAERWQQYEDVLAECAAKVPVADRALHSTATNVRDLLELLAELRRQWGYEEFVLYGASYGSRLALEAAHHNAQQPADRQVPIARVVLDALYAPGIDLELRYPRTIEEMTAAFADYCTNVDGCDTAPPVQERLLAALERAEREPVLHALDPGDYGDEYGELALRVDAAQLLALLDHALSANMQPERLPAMLDDFNAGRWTAEWNALAVEAIVSGLDPEWKPLTFHLVECSDNGGYTAADYAALLERYPRYGRWLPYLPESEDMCERLGVQRRSLRAHDADVDALVVTMQLDPITPPAAARHAVRRLRNAEWRVVAGAGHAAVDNDGCAARAVGAYMNAGTLAAWSQCNLVDTASLQRERLAE